MPMAVVHPCDRESLLGAVEAARMGLIVPLSPTGGRTAHQLYEAFGARIESSTVDPGRLELWWTDDGETCTAP